ncbi:MAG TPA: tetratricopeptide repeat protein, partial [Abditibacteriaceae bacterium]|nr:tetratricopeptide repeat protein [Abditibacteriaceae bacterium]
MMQHLSKRLIVLALSLLLPASAVRAANYALLVGIEEYRDQERIRPFDAAVADVRGLGKALQEVASFPAPNVRVLANDADPKPTRANILSQLEQLAGKVKPADVVLIAFISHAVELDKNTYLLPWDSDGASAASLKSSALPAATLQTALAKLRPATLIVAYDMWRENPRRNGGEPPLHNMLGEPQLKALTPASGPGAHSAVALYAGSRGMRSWAWQSRKRGYFAYFLEEGLRRGAADETGVVRVLNLVEYTQKAVYGAVQRDLGRAQKCIWRTVGTEAMEALEAVLARGRPAGSGGATAVPAVVGDGVEARYEAAMQRGYELSEAGSHVEAQESFREAMRLNPLAARPAFALAQALRWSTWGYEKTLTHWDNEMSKRGRWAAHAGVVEHYHKAMQLDPRAVQPVVSLARYELELGLYMQAEAHYRQAMELDPRDATPVYPLGWIHHHVKRDYATAEQLYRQAMELDPQWAEPVYALGQLEQKVKANNAAAESLYRRARELEPEWPMPVWGLAKIYHARKEHAQAERAYRTALEMSQWPAIAVDLADFLYDAKKDEEGAERLYLKTLEYDYADAWLVLRMSAFYVKSKRDYGAVEAAYRKLMRLHPENGQIIVNFAAFYLHLHEYTQAERMYRTAIELNPRWVRPVIDLAQVYRTTKKHDEAERLYLKAVELAPGQAW